MPLLGAHMSIAGGYYKAVEAAAACKMNVVQIFTKNNNQWRAKEITSAEADRFKQSLRDANITHPLSHDSYLINLASPDPLLWRKSLEAFVVELQRAALLGIPYVVTHPGAYTTSSEAAGLVLAARAVNEALKQTRGLPVGVLLENTAGQGSCLGWKFEHLAKIMDKAKQPERLGVCIDTCHTFAAGYPLHSQKEYRATMKALDQCVGLKHVKAFHLNDSQREMGSRVDRHAHIGEGKLGLDPFRWLLNDRRFQDIPMYLETPKGMRGGEDLDRVNLRTLRSLVAS